MDTAFTELVNQELKDIEEKLHAIHEEEEIIKAQTAERLETLGEESKRLETKLHHLKALLILEGHTVLDDGSQGFNDPVPVSSVRQPIVTRSASLADKVYKLLSERGKEHHYKELVGALESSGIKVPGKDPGLNLIAHIYDDKRFVRPTRGVYGLREWYSKNLRSVGARKRKTSKRRKSRK